MSTTLVSLWVSALTRVFIPAGTTWLFSRYVIKAPPLQFGAEVILSLTSLGLLLPLILLLLGINLGVRFFFSLVLKFFYGPHIYLMGGRDSFVSHDEYANSCNHYSLYVIKGRCDLEKIRNKFDRILEERAEDGEIVYDRMKRRLVKKFGYYCWEHLGDQFDIRRHVKYITPKGEEEVLDEAQVFQEIKKLYDHPFGGDKPQWEILVIPNFKYAGAGELNNNENEETMSFSSEFESRLIPTHYGFIVRMHHSIMDGISAGNALQHYMADAPCKLTVDPLSKAHAWGWGKTFGAYTQLALLGPRAFFRTLFLDETNCFHGPQLKGPKALSWSRPVNVEALRKIKESSRTSVTAVLVSALGGSVRNLAIKKSLPVPGQVHAFPTIGILPFPDIKPRNRFTMALLPLCIGLESAGERLRSAENSLKALLRSPDVLTNYHLMQVFGVLPVRVINFFLEKCHATLLLSNVPGPAEKASIFGGDEIVDIGIWAPIQLGIGIGMSTFSYGGIVRATVVADATACPDEEDVPTIITEFEKEVLALAKLANVPSHQVFKTN